MQQSSELVFVSSNTHKFDEAKRILSKMEIDLTLFKTELEEIQSDSLLEIAKHKAIDAYTKLQKPIIIEERTFLSVIYKKKKFLQLILLQKGYFLKNFGAKFYAKI